MKYTPLIASGILRNKDGWRISKYKAAGDKYFTLKIRKIERPTRVVLH